MWNITSPFSFQFIYHCESLRILYTFTEWTLLHNILLKTSERSKGGVKAKISVNVFQVSQKHKLVKSCYTTLTWALLDICHFNTLIFKQATQRQRIRNVGVKKSNGTGAEELAFSCEMGAVSTQCVLDCVYVCGNVCGISSGRGCPLTSDPRSRTVGASVHGTCHTNTSSKFQWHLIIHSYFTHLTWSNGYSISIM